MDIGIIQCSLRIRGVQSFVSFVLLLDDAGKPYAEIGMDKDGKPIPHCFDSAQIIPDRAGTARHQRCPVMGVQSEA